MRITIALLFGFTSAILIMFGTDKDLTTNQTGTQTFWWPFLLAMILHGFWQGLQAQSEHLYAGQCVNDEVRNSFFSQVQSTGFLVAQSLAAAVACVLIFVSQMEHVQIVVGVFMFVEFAAILVMTCLLREVSSADRKAYYVNVNLD